MLGNLCHDLNMADELREIHRLVISVGARPSNIVTSINRSLSWKTGRFMSALLGKVVPKGVKPMNKTLVTFAAGISLALFNTAAFAQSQNCAPREIVLKRLSDKYGESRQSIGMGQRGMLMETFASAESGSWTITVTTPQGMTCLVASGQSYEILAEAQPLDDHEI